MDSGTAVGCLAPLSLAPTMMHTPSPSPAASSTPRPIQRVLPCARDPFAPRSPVAACDPFPVPTIPAAAPDHVPPLTAVTDAPPAAERVTSRLSPPLSFSPAGSPPSSSPPTSRAASPNGRPSPCGAAAASTAAAPTKRAAKTRPPLSHPPATRPTPSRPSPAPPSSAIVSAAGSRRCASSYSAPLGVATSAPTPSSASLPVPPATPEPALALLHSMISLGAALGRVDKCFSGVYLVVERGDGSKSRPYDGEVIDCVSDSVTDAFKDAFKQAWWRARRPSLGPAVVVGRGGSVAQQRSRSGTAPAAGVGAGNAVVVDGPDGSPPLSLHPPSVLLKAKSAVVGIRILTNKMVDDVLQSLGLATINQMTTTRVKNIFKRISSAVTPPGKGRLQWTWPQACPMELLMNYWQTEEMENKITVHAGCLYPPWHNIVKTSCGERRLAVIVAAWLSDYWMYNLCMELKVKWTADFRSKFGCAEAAASGLAPLTKKRARSEEKESGKSPKKKRGTGPPHATTTDKRQSPAARKAAAAATATGEDGSAVGAKGSAPATGGADDSLRSTGSSRPLSHVLRDAEGCTLRGLAASTDVSSVEMESSSIENAFVDEEERQAATRAGRFQSLLLPYELVVECMKDYSTNLDASTCATSDAILKVSSHSIPRTTLTREAVMDMLSVHTFNKDVAMLKQSFEWLGDLAGSLEFFPEGLGPIFSPTASVAAIAGDVLEWLSNSRIGDDAWRFFAEEFGANGAEAGDNAYGGQTVNIREVASACQTSWLTSAMINACMVKQRVAARSVGGYTLLIEQVASVLRIRGKEVAPEAAQTAATEVAAEVGACRWLGMVVNLCNSHWVSAVVNVVGREVVVYDSLPGTRDAEMALAIERILVLCSAVARKQVALPGENCGRNQGWTVTRCEGPTQPDGHSCGVYAVAHVACALGGFALSSTRPRADLLRLALIHHVLSRGRHYASARLAWRGASAPPPGGAVAVV